MHHSVNNYQKATSIEDGNSLLFTQIMFQHDGKFDQAAITFDVFSLVKATVR